MNNADDFTEEDIRLFEAVDGMDVIVLINKTDLPRKLDLNQVKDKAKDYPIIMTSLKEEVGVDQLEEAIASLFFEGNLQMGDATYVSNSRHIALLNQAKKAIEDALEGIEAGVPIDLVQIDLTKSWEMLGEIIGDSVQESLIDQLFSQFCLGK